MSLNSWLYRGGRPNGIARAINRVTGAIYGRGVSPDYLVELEVRGRKSGQTIRFPLVMVNVEGGRYLVSMLGQDVNWVRNVRAAGGEAVVRHGRREEVQLEEVPVGQRAPVLETYLEKAPSARTHFPVPKDASLADLERMAPDYPVFRVVASGTG